MKKQQTIRELLGVTQQQMAMILKIHSSQWSMYESGKRDLPPAATIRLAEMLAYMHSAEAKGFNNVPQLAKQQNNTNQELEKVVKENQYQLLVVTKKIAAMQKKHDAATKALQLLHFLSSGLENKTDAPDILKSIEARATKSLDNNGLLQLHLLRTKEISLQQQQELLKEILRE